MSYCVTKVMKALKRVGTVSKALTCTGVENKKIATSSRATHAVSLEESSSTVTHIPVMTKEVMDLLQVKKEQTVVDMTFGGGGHSRQILQAAPGVKLVALDRDPLAFELAQQLAQEQQEGAGGCAVIPVLGRFSELASKLRAAGIQEGQVDHFLFDLGASSMQFHLPHRGFSISKDGPLDMRMDGNRFADQPTAADVVNHMDARDLAVLLKGYGEERRAHSIAQAIVEARYAFGNITRTKQLAQIVDAVFEGNYKQDKLQRHAHPATKVFQSLRIFVNNELNELNNGLELACRFLRPGGLCVVIAFHSLEDRIVKRHFHDIDLDAQANLSVSDHYRNSNVLHSMQEVEELMAKRWEPAMKKVSLPTDEEVNENPRSRSAKLRAAYKL